MKIRQSLPRPLRNALRDLTVGAGRLTASYRVEPAFIVAGAQRCGTTSLFRAFEQHPQLIRPSFHKGINYFDLNYDRGQKWYAAHYPLLASSTLRTSSAYRPLLPFEASGYYLFHPEAIQRIAKDFPTVKIVLMLRDPIERAYSAWKHEQARGFETEPILRALELEEERLDGETARMLSDPYYESHAHRHQAYCARSDYVQQIQKLHTHISPDQVHVVFSEDFFAHPQDEMQALETFLGAKHHSGIEFDRHNARPSGAMPNEARDLLRVKLAGTYDHISALVGKPAPWQS